jgi:hypothetical protein
MLRIGERIAYEESEPCEDDECSCAVYEQFLPVESSVLHFFFHCSGSSVLVLFFSTRLLVPRRLAHGMRRAVRVDVSWSQLVYLRV